MGVGVVKGGPVPVGTARGDSGRGQPGKCIIKAYRGHL